MDISALTDVMEGINPGFLQATRLESERHEAEVARFHRDICGDAKDTETALKLISVAVHEAREIKDDRRVWMLQCVWILERGTLPVRDYPDSIARVIDDLEKDVMR